MNKVLGRALLLGCFSLGHLATAATLHTDMATIATAYAAFNKSGTTSEANTALAQMRQAALDSKQSLPEKLKNKTADNSDVQDYQAGLDQLIAEIDKTSALVSADQLEQAKTEGKNLLNIRNENHKRFK